MPPLCHCYCVEGRRWPQWRGLSGLPMPPLTEAGLAQVTDLTAPRFSFLEGGGSRGWGRESEISILWASLSQAFRPQDTSQK